MRPAAMLAAAVLASCARAPAEPLDGAGGRELDPVRDERPRFESACANFALCYPEEFAHQFGTQTACVESWLADERPFSWKAPRLNEAPGRLFAGNVPMIA